MAESRRLRKQQQDADHISSWPIPAEMHEYLVDGESGTHIRGRDSGRLTGVAESLRRTTDTAKGRAS